jgi:hypothetical protein
LKTGPLQRTRPANVSVRGDADASPRRARGWDNHSRAQRTLGVARRRGRLIRALRAEYVRWSEHHSLPCGEPNKGRVCVWRS